MSPFSAFTLVELLVVVSILALLIAILLPSLAKARQQAKAGACSSNLHQLGIALSSYVMTCNYYPGHHSDPGETWPGRKWGTEVAIWPPRLRAFTNGNTQVFWCPSADAVTRWIVRVHPNPSFNWGGPYYPPREYPITSSSFFSYGYNDWGTQEFARPHLGLGAWVGHPQYGELAEARVRVPGDMIALADSNADKEWDTAIDPAVGELKEAPSKRHYGGAEVLFCDSHVAWVRQKLLVADEPVARRRWNNDHQSHDE